MDSLIVVARPVGEKTVTYNDGDVVFEHQTLLHFGDRIRYTPEQVRDVIAVCGWIAANTNPITSMVIGKGMLGKDGDLVALLESREMNVVHQVLLENQAVQDMLDAYLDEQHPNWIQHITGYQNLHFGDYITFDRLGVWNGDEHTDFNFQYQAVFPG